MYALTIIAHPTKVDTLQTEIHKLHSTVDSLNRQVHDFGIASTYYHDIVNTDVATFIGFMAIVVTLAGLISWGFIRWTMLKIKRELSAQIHAQEERFQEFNKTFDEEIASFDNKHIEYSFNSSRLMYMAAINDSQFLQALIWSLNTILQSFKMDGKIIGFHTTVWIKNVTELLNKDLPKVQVELLIGNIEDLVTDLRKLKDKDIDKVVEQVKAKVYKVIYT